MPETKPLPQDIIEQITDAACDAIMQRLGPCDEASFNICYVNVLSAVANLAEARLRRKETTY